MKTYARFFATVIGCLTLVAAAGAVEVNKANSTTTLNLAGSWVSGGPPGLADIAVWNTEVTTTTTYTLGSSVSWAGLKVVSPALDQRIRPTTGLSLTLGAAGVDLTGATRNFAADSTVLLAADQSWNIAAGRTLSTAGLASSGGYTLTKNGEGILSLTGVTVFAGGLSIQAGSVQSANTGGIQELSGALSGAGPFNKSGAGGLSLSGDNTNYTGALTLTAGSLNLNRGSALGGGTLTLTGGSLGNTSGVAVTLTAGSTQNWNGDFSYTGTSDLDLGGSAVTLSGTRALTVGSNTLTVSGTLGGTGSLTKLGAGTLRVAAGAAVDLTGKLATTAGVLRIDGGTVTCGTAAGNFEVGGTGAVELNGGALVVPAVAGLGGTSSLAFNGGVLRASAGSTTFMRGLANAKIGAAGVKIDTNGNAITIAQPLLHDPALVGTADGGLVLIGSNALTLTGASTYTGPTTVTDGTLVLGSGGSIAFSPRIELAETGNFDGGTIGTTLTSGQTLTGTGGLAGKIAVGAGATLAPGSVSTIGSLVGSADLSLAGIANFRINKLGALLTTDAVVSNSVKYGGTLAVTATGSALAAGDSFKLFDASTYSGAFVTLSLPALPDGFYWETAMLTVDGTISVTNSLPIPVFSPPAGGYVGAQSVTISGQVGSTIRYTIDGTDPVSSDTAVNAASPVAGIVVPNSSTDFTIKAYVSMAGLNSSAVATAVYQTYPNPIWSKDGSGAWWDAGNWMGGVIASGSGGIADLSALTLSSSPTVTLDAELAIGVLRFGDLGAAFSWSIGGAGLTLVTPTGQPEVLVRNGTLVTHVALKGTQGFVKNGPGNWTINGDQAISGALTINGGTVMTGGGNSANGALGGASSITINGAKVGCVGDNSLMGWGAKSLPITLNAGAVLTGNAVTATNIQELIFAGGELASAASTHGTYGSWNLNKSMVVTEDSLISALNMQFQTSLASPTITVDAGKTLTVSGFFENLSKTTARPLTKAGAGTILMNGVNTYTGSTTINAGTLRVNGSLAAASAVAVASGATLGGIGTAAGAVTVSTGAWLAPGGDGAGTLTTGAATLAGTYRCEVDGANCDKLAVAGNLNLNGAVLEVAVLAGGSGQGPYLIATYTGTRTGSFATVPAGFTVDYATANQIKLVSAAVGDPFDAWALANGITGGKGGDDDGDGVKNLLEFATNSEPGPATGGGSSGPRCYPLMFTTGGDKALTYTIAVRKSAIFTAVGSAQTATRDKIKYTVEASDHLGVWNVVTVTEVLGDDALAVQAALGAKLSTPALGTDWEWHTFRSDGGAPADPGDFLRLKVEDVP